MSFSYDEISEILKLIDNSSCDELIVETADMKLVVRRNGASSGPAVVSELKTSALPPSTGQPAPPETRAASPKIEPGQGQIEVSAPMVGTFYRAPSPEAPPFVEIGSAVRKGQPLCLIEVMKLFTTIAADQDGRITQILPANGDLVEFDQVLFVVEPA